MSNPAIVARLIRGEKGGARIEEPLSIHSDNYGTLRPARFPKILNPVKSGNGRATNRVEDFVP